MRNSPIGSLIIVGDMFPVKSNMELFTNGNAKQLFGEKICTLFYHANYRICNLEGALTDGTQRCIKTGPVITAPTAVINAYKALGINYCMLANNHITDAGNQGVEDTMNILKENGIGYIGAGKNGEIPHELYLSIGNKEICIYNVCETMYNKPTPDKAGAYIYDEYVVCKELASIKSKVDHLIVIYHGGIEKFSFPSPEVRKRFYRMAESGADVILSQHTHCIGCEEYYKGAYLLYGQGDFLFNNFCPEITEKGLIIEVIFQNEGIIIKKHITRCQKNFCLKYDERQDLSNFTRRSQLVKDEDFVIKEFKKFCKRELHIYLTAFKSPGIFHRLIRRLSRNRFYTWLQFNAFRERDLLFILHTLRSEQNRETALTGIQTLLEQANKI